MAGKSSRLKPDASSSVHLFVAASLWTVVGIGLMSRGVIWLSAIGKIWILIPAFLTGSLKSFYMLDNSARKSIHRIIKTRHGRCLGGVYSVKTWCLVLVMMTAGYLMRHSSLPKEFLGFFYVSIGWGLLLSSRHAWIAWKNNTETVPDEANNKDL